MAISRQMWQRIERALRRLEEDPAVRQAFMGGEDTAIPVELAAIRDTVTMRFEGGYQNHDSAGGTLAGMTNRVFRTQMARLGEITGEDINLTREESREVLAEIGRGIRLNSECHPVLRDNATERQRTLWPLFENLNDTVHYRLFNQHPGFGNMPTEMQRALYDTAYNRGNGVALLAAARMFERYGIADFPGINSTRNPEALDADPVVMERFLAQHIARNNGVLPLTLARELRERGLTVNGQRLVDGRLVNADASDGVHIAYSRNFTDIDVSQRVTEPLSAASVVILTPYDDRMALAAPGSAARNRWDAMVDRVADATQSVLHPPEGSTRRPWTANQIINGIEAERRNHFLQLRSAQGDNNRYADGWNARSLFAARTIPTLATGTATPPPDPAERPDPVTISTDEVEDMESYELVRQDTEAELDAAADLHQERFIAEVRSEVAQWTQATRLQNRPVYTLARYLAGEEYSNSQQNMPGVSAEEGYSSHLYNDALVAAGISSEFRRLNEQQTMDLRLEAARHILADLRDAGVTQFENVSAITLANTLQEAMYAERNLRPTTTNSNRTITRS